MTSSARIFLTSITSPCAYLYHARTLDEASGLHDSAPQKMNSRARTVYVGDTCTPRNVPGHGMPAAEVCGSDHLHFYLTVLIVCIIIQDDPSMV